MYTQTYNTDLTAGRHLYTKSVVEGVADESGWDAFVRVSLCLESRSRKALEKQYLFHGSYKLSVFFFFFK